MVRNKEYRRIGEHKEKIDKVTFIVNAFADKLADKTSEQLVMQMLEAKVTNDDFKMEECA
ncbi:MAG: hypothetical protein K2H23_08880 [Oscillospiraceae bacterium]|nr:hypothetical protein [Oscillospiraceae bacterium]